MSTKKDAYKELVEAGTLLQKLESGPKTPEEFCEGFEAVLVVLRGTQELLRSQEPTANERAQLRQALKGLGAAINDMREIASRSRSRAPERI